MSVTAPASPPALVEAVARAVANLKKADWYIRYEAAKREAAAKEILGEDKP